MESEPADVQGTTTAKAKGKRGPRNTDSSTYFTTGDYLFIVNWLAHEPNYNMLYGAAQKTSVGKGTIKISDGYAQLAAEVVRRSKGRIRSLTGKQMRDRLEYYKTRYNAARRWKESTGAGVTDEDRTKGIHTIEEKLHTKCSFFDKMDEIFGNKANVDPPFTLDSSALRHGMDFSSALAVEDESSDGGENPTAAAVETAELVGADEGDTASDVFRHPSSTPANGRAASIGPESWRPLSVTQDT